MNLTIGHLNVHKERRAIRHMVGLGLDSLGLDELPQRGPLVLGSRRYRVAGGRRVRAATPILTRRDWPYLGELVVQASEEATPSSLAPARLVTVALFGHPTMGPVAHLNVHPNARTDNLAPTVDRARESEELWTTVARILEWLRRDRYRIVLSGDLNHRRGARTTGPGPAEALRAGRLTWAEWEGLDAIAHSRSLRAVRTEVIPREVTGSDHPGLVAELARVL